MAKVPAFLGRKLFRVLVMGGAVIAASCASVPKSGSSGNGSKPAESDASRSGKSEPTKESGGGVPGW